MAVARRKCKRSRLCHPVSVTYDPERHGGGRVPVLRDEWREPLRAQRDPLAEDSGRARSNRDEHRRLRKQTWLGRFISTYGWRAYALPVLIALTGVVVYQTITGTSAPAPKEAEGPVQGPPTIGVASTQIIGAPPKGLTQFDVNLPTGILPEGGPFTEAGCQDMAHRAGHHTQGRRGHGQGVHLHRSRSKTASTPPRSAATTDSLGWSAKRWPIPRVGRTTRSSRSPASTAAQPDFRVSLSSPMTVREGCGYDIQLEASCYNPAYADSQPRVFINEARWVRGAVPFQGDVGSYRQYLINHEVGHAIGYQRHEPCGTNGELAPVMMQQTFSTNNNDAARFDPESVKPDGKTCRFNPWPYPIA